METRSVEITFRILSGFSRFVLTQKLEEFVSLLISYSRKAQSKTVQKILEKSDLEQQVFNSANEFLYMLSQNQHAEYVFKSIEKWEDDRLYSVTKYEIEAEDIIEINNIRQSSLFDLASDFCDTKSQLCVLHKEINEFFSFFNKKLFAAYNRLFRQKLQSSEEQLLEAQSIAQVGSFRWDLNNPAKESSPQLRRILETDKAQTFTEFLQHVHQEDRQKLEDEFRRSLECGTFECEYRYQINNKIKTLHTRAVVDFKDSKPIIMKGTVQDITVWKKIETELIQKSVELKESNTRLEHFAAIAGHDLKEPLRKISTYASFIDSIDKEALSGSGQDYLKKILSTTDRMRRLIDNLLAYSSLQKDGQRSYCSLEQILQEAVESLELKIKEKEARVLSDGLPHAIVIPFQIQQLFQNLLSNALKFCKKDEKPVVLVSHSIFDPVPYGSGGKKLTIEITDNCIGFNNIHCDKVFDVFYRLHDKTTFEGTGLGLAICRKIVENHNGTITVTSKENEGSTFKIVLPYEN
jgi:signal transduction histidine kinase